MWKTEIIPQNWTESTIIQLSKDPNSIGVLDKMRHIHDRQELFKIFGQVVTICVKDIIFQRMTKFQIACKPKHRPSEHLYVVKSVLSNLQEEKKCYIATSFDLKKFFDFEEIKDVMESLYSNNVKHKLYRLVYNMNKNVNIKVKTPFGVTESKPTGPIVTQGGVESAVISSNNVDTGLKEAFAEEEKELIYEELVVKALGYMDDIFRMSETRENAQYGNDAIYNMIHKKNLELNYDKSVYTIMGNKKAGNKMKQKLKQAPLMIGEVLMKETREVKYLGDFLTEDLSESVPKTLLKRIHRNGKICCL